MKTQNYLCVDLRTETNKSLVENQAVNGQVVMDKEGEHFVFVETPSTTAIASPASTVLIKQHVMHPELHWRLLNRTKHGRVTVNSQHVKVEFYVRHGDYQDGANLADLLASEIETIGEALCETDLKTEIEKCC